MKQLATGKEQLQLLLPQYDMLMQAKSVNHVLSLDASLTQQLQWLKDLLWFDAIALDDKESIQDTLNITQDGCRW